MTPLHVDPLGERLDTANALQSMQFTPRTPI
jgi:hypothetical protein